MLSKVKIVLASPVVAARGSSVVKNQIKKVFMKICITASNDSVDSQINSRFGRCDYFIIWDSVSNTTEAIANPNVNAGSGAGIQSAQMVADQRASIVITGEVGPKAEKVLKAAKINIITGISGTVKEAIEKYKTARE